MYGAAPHWNAKDENTLAFPQYVHLLFLPRPLTYPPTPRWLGQNSMQNQLTRQLAEIRTCMRLIASGDKNELRQSYIPVLLPHLVH
jgi:hypothetical protein